MSRCVAAVRVLSYAWLSVCN